jgi:hypothetical protein
VSEFCYTTVPGKLKTLLGKIRDVGVPKKVTIQWLKTLGFTSSNDKTLIGVLKQIDFIDANGIPTPRWAQYRGAHYKKVLGEAVVHGYGDLYAVYPDAHQRSQSDLEHVFSTHSSGGKQVIGKTMSTYRTLVEVAEFPQGPGLVAAAAAAPAPSLPGSDATPSVAAAHPAAGEDVGQRPNLHIDIQVHISPEASAEQIEKVFESMARHLYGTKRSGE